MDQSDIPYEHLLVTHYYYLWKIEQFYNIVRVGSMAVRVIAEPWLNQLNNDSSYVTPN